MTGAGVTLLIGWVLGHFLVVASIADPRRKRWLFLVAGMCFLLIYLVKPYSYDLSKYSIFFNTGFIQTETWGWNTADTINLHPKDLTGEPFESGFEVGFRLMAKLGNAVLPTGSLIPRFNPDSGKFGHGGGAPPLDAMLYFIMAFGFTLLYVSVKLFSDGDETDVLSINVLQAAPIILGSVFFVLGSQNALRQFLGIAIIVLAMSMLRSNRYVASLMLILVSGAFHKWAPFIGMVGLLVIMLGETRPGTRAAREIRPTRLEQHEVWLICIGVITAVFVKMIAVLGIFNADIPLVGVLKPYLVNAGEHASLGRIEPILKVLSLIAVIGISELLLGRTQSFNKGNIRSVRRGIFILLLPLSIYPEIFSRLLMLYWGFEVVFIVWAINSQIIRHRLAGAFVFLSYGFAPNAINVLIGPNWISTL